VYYGIGGAEFTNRVAVSPLPTQNFKKNSENGKLCPQLFFSPVSIFSPICKQNSDDVYCVSRSQTPRSRVFAITLSEVSKYASCTLMLANFATRKYASSAPNTTSSTPIASTSRYAVITSTWSVVASGAVHILYNAKLIF